MSLGTLFFTETSFVWIPRKERKVCGNIDFFFFLDSFHQRKESLDGKLEKSSTRANAFVVILIFFFFF